MKRYATYLLSFILLTACAEPTAPKSPSDLEFAIISTKNSYAVGETVSAKLLNRSDKQLGYGACAVALERYAGGKWVHVWPTSGACIAILYVLGKLCIGNAFSDVARNIGAAESTLCD